MTETLIDIRNLHKYFGALEVLKGIDVEVRRGERIAVFRYANRVSAVSNVCKHQGGPLGEGRIVDGCITCPWHGFQYRPDTGTSPPPFAEKIATYRTKIVDGVVFVHVTALEPGTTVLPSLIEA